MSPSPSTRRPSPDQKAISNFASRWEPDSLFPFPVSPFRRLLVHLGLPLLSLLWGRGLADAETIAPTVEALFPESGFVFSLSQIEVHFSEPVQGVDAADLRVNGLAATSVRQVSPDVYGFTVPEPPRGTTTLTWSTEADIRDLADIPNRFAGTAPVEYTLLPPPRPRGSDPVGGGARQPEDPPG